MRVMGIIPARAGSKRLRNKNTKLLGGLPLWRHALAHARSSCVIDMSVITTDDPAIAKAHDGSWEHVIRPERLCGDDVEMFPVIAHAYETAAVTSLSFDAVCILQPTSPFRTGADIARCVEMMIDTGGESVVSVTEGPNDLAFQVRHARRLERLPSIVVPNGAIYLLRVDTMLAGRDWYGPHAYGYVMPKERGMDINISFDFETAERYLPNMRVTDV